MYARACEGSGTEPRNAILKNHTSREGLVRYIYIFNVCYLLDSVTMGTSISSMEMPPCWKVSRKYWT